MQGEVLMILLQHQSSYKVSEVEIKYVILLKCCMSIIESFLYLEYFNLMLVYKVSIMFQR